MRLYLRVDKRVHEVDAPGGRLGSAEGLAVCLRDPSVLAEHAALGWDGKSWWVAQLGSKPVYVDGEPLSGQQARLHPQGVLQVGNVMMDYWQEGATPPRRRETMPTHRPGTPHPIEATVRIPAKLEILSLAQPGSLRGDQVPTLIQRSSGRGMDPEKTLMRPLGHQRNPGEAKVIQESFSAANTLVTATNKGMLALPASAKAITPEAPIEPPVVHAHLLAEDMLIRDQPPKPIERAPAPPVHVQPVITSQSAVPTRTPRNWDLAIQVLALLGLLALTCLVSFVLGMRAAQ